MNDELDIQSLKPWVEQSLRDNTHLLAAGYQGKTLFYDKDDVRLVIKVPHGSGLTKVINQRLLRHENAVYQQLNHSTCTARCYGLIDNTYLVIEYIDAKIIRHARPDRDSPFYATLLDAIKTLHKHNVAHFDLKRKANLLVDNDQRPVIIDFGAAVIYKPGFHPLNHYLFKLAKRFDFNAWIKHKYQHHMDEISVDDRQYYDRTLVEKISHFLKRRYRILKGEL